MRIGIIGLGYVGLPLALSFARKYPECIGFDINREKIAELRSGVDSTREADPEDLKRTTLKITSDESDLQGVDIFIVAVPTPIDDNRKPDLTPVISASETVARVLSKGGIVVYESTVYPGVTEEICGPILERISGLKQGRDFKLGYSPERINPGDKEHTFERIIKVVAGEDSQTTETLCKLYGSVVTAGVFPTSSIRVAEAAKVIENTQRDLNIALMNELAIIFDKLEIPTREVLAAAGTKWNFLKFTPGLVGGHCIGVDPYYLTSKAEQVGYYPQVILAGRRINDGMGAFIAQKLVKLLINRGVQIKGAKVGLLGLTFKEDVPDLRNSRVPDIYNELKDFGVQVIVHDPSANSHEAEEEYGLTLSELREFHDLDALIVAVAHREYRDLGERALSEFVKKDGAVIDVKSILKADTLRADLQYWSL